MPAAERYVAITEMRSEQAPGTLQAEGDMGVPKPVEFLEVDMRYFRAEYTPEGRDIIVHFFVSETLRAQWHVDTIERWWLNAFPQALSAVAQEHFNATVPRIMAKYTPEVASWWFKAQGFDYLLDREAFLRAFFALLDETLHASLLQGVASPTGRA